MASAVELLGEMGLPEPMSSIAAKEWDVVVIGGGHNGLTTAAYLARAGQSVLVLERSERVGGACTLERPFDDQRYVVSPCAYVVGLLDQRVIDELSLSARGLRIFVADPNLWAPFADGTSFTQWADHARTQQSLDDLGVPASDAKGYWAYEELFDTMRRRLRKGRVDTWVGESPDRAELEALLEHDQFMIDVLFDASIAEVLDEFIGHEKLRDALFGQAVIGAYAGPFDKGTASVKLMHYQGDLEHQGPVWGYVEGGMGMVSFTIADAATEAGATIACGVEVAEIDPSSSSVTLEKGDVIRAKTIVCNADPKRLLGMLGDTDVVPAAYRSRLEEWKTRSPVVKFNAALGRLPTFPAAHGESFPFRSMITATNGLHEAQEAFRDCDRGVPNVGFGEIYFQTGFDPSPAPEGKHLMSVFGQYAPYELASGTWDDHRQPVTQQFIDLISTFAPDLVDCIEHVELLAAPDIESRTGLTGGHIFQGETMPDQMWEHRLSARTPIPGVYLCGAATHPAGSVIALNGRNAAEAVLEDLRSHQPTKGL